MKWRKKFLYSIRFSRDKREHWRQYTEYVIAKLLFLPRKKIRQIFKEQKHTKLNSTFQGKERSTLSPHTKSRKYFYFLPQKNFVKLLEYKIILSSILHFMDKRVRNRQKSFCRKKKSKSYHARFYISGIM